MINRIYKTIHNKYSRFFKFIFFLRYVFLVFFISIALFLLIPNFFDYKKKENIIKSLIFKNYALKIEELEDIKFKSFPIPHLEIKNLNSKLFSNEINIKTKTLKIYPRIENIYNFK